MQTPNPDRVAEQVSLFSVPKDRITAGDSWTPQDISRYDQPESYLDTKSRLELRKRVFLEEIKEKQEQIAETKEALTEPIYESYITTLQAQIDSLEAELSVLNSEISSLDQELTTLEASKRPEGFMSNLIQSVIPLYAQSLGTVGIEGESKYLVGNIRVNWLGDDNYNISLAFKDEATSQTNNTVLTLSTKVEEITDVGMGKNILYV